MKYSTKYTLQDGVIFLDGNPVEQSEVLRDLINSNEQLNRFDDLMKELPECPEHGECIPYAINWIKEQKRTANPESYQIPIISIIDGDNGTKRIAIEDPISKHKITFDPNQIINPDTAKQLWNVLNLKQD